MSGPLSTDGHAGAKHHLQGGSDEKSATLEHANHINRAATANDEANLAAAAEQVDMATEEKIVEADSPRNAQQASPFAAAATAQPESGPPPNGSIDTSRTLTTGLDSFDTPASETTPRLSGSGSSVNGSALLPSRSGRDSRRRISPSGPTPATSMSTGLGSDPSVASDTTLPPAPSGELAAVFSAPPSLNPAGSGSERVPRGGRFRSPVATPPKPDPWNVTPSGSLSTGVADDLSTASDDTLAHVAAMDISSRRDLRHSRSLSGKRLAAGLPRLSPSSLPGTPTRQSSGGSTPRTPGAEMGMPSMLAIPEGEQPSSSSGEHSDSHPEAAVASEQVAHGCSGGESIRSNDTAGKRTFERESSSSSSGSSVTSPYSGAPQPRRQEAGNPALRQPEAASHKQDADDAADSNTTAHSKAAQHGSVSELRASQQQNSATPSKLNPAAAEFEPFAAATTQQQEEADAAAKAAQPAQAVPDQSAHESPSPAVSEAGESRDSLSELATIACLSIDEGRGPPGSSISSGSTAFDPSRVPSIGSTVAVNSLETRIPSIGSTIVARAPQPAAAAAADSAIEQQAAGATVMAEAALQPAITRKLAQMQLEQQEADTAAAVAQLQSVSLVAENSEATVASTTVPADPPQPADSAAGSSQPADVQGDASCVTEAQKPADAQDVSAATTARSKAGTTQPPHAQDASDEVADRSQPDVFPPADARVPPVGAAAQSEAQTAVAGAAEPQEQRNAGDGPARADTKAAAHAQTSERGQQQQPPGSPLVPAPSPLQQRSAPAGAPAGEPPAVPASPAVAPAASAQQQDPQQDTQHQLQPPQQLESPVAHGSIAEEPNPPTTSQHAPALAAAALDMPTTPPRQQRRPQQHLSSGGGSDPSGMHGRRQPAGSLHSTPTSSSSPAGSLHGGSPASLQGNSPASLQGGSPASSWSGSPYRRSFSELPLASQAGLAMGPQRNPPHPWPLPDYRPPSRPSPQPNQLPPPPAVSSSEGEVDPAHRPFADLSKNWRSKEAAERAEASFRAASPSGIGSSEAVGSTKPTSEGISLAESSTVAAGSCKLSALLGAARLSQPAPSAAAAAGTHPLTGGAQAAQQQELGGAATSGAILGRPSLDDGQSEHSVAWRRQRRHFFILTHAGKPIFARHGEEGALASFMALIQALASFARDRGDAVQSVRSGKHLVVLVERGPLILVAVSSCGEPAVALKGQLELLHGQVTLIVTNAIDRLLSRNPRSDGRNLLIGASTVLRALSDAMERQPWGLLPAFPPSPLAAPLRQSAVLALHSAVKGCGAMYGVILNDAGLIAVAGPKGGPVLHPWDLLLLATFLRANDSLRQGESMCPVCLPRLNPGAFLHAYIAFLHPASGLVVTLLSARPDSFAALAHARTTLESQLHATGVLQALREAAEQPGSGGLQLSVGTSSTSTAALESSIGSRRSSRTASPASRGSSIRGQERGSPRCGPEDMTVPAGPLVHFVYHVPLRRQYLSPAAPHLLPGLSPEDCMAAIARTHVAIFGEAATASECGGSGSTSSTSNAGPPPLQRMHFVSDATMTVLAYAGPEFVLYTILQPLVTKAAALDACNALCAWLRNRQVDLFLPL